MSCAKTHQKRLYSLTCKIFLTLYILVFVLSIITISSQILQFTCLMKKEPNQRWMSLTNSTGRSPIFVNVSRDGTEIFHCDQTVFIVGVWRKNRSLIFRSTWIHIQNYWCFFYNMSKCLSSRLKRISSNKSV
jgi:hypothetical protein